MESTVTGLYKNEKMEERVRKLEDRIVDPAQSKQQRINRQIKCPVWAGAVAHACNPSTLGV